MASTGSRCQLDDEMTRRSVEYLWMKIGRCVFFRVDGVNETPRFRLENVSWLYRVGDGYTLGCETNPSQDAIVTRIIF